MYKEHLLLNIKREITLLKQLADNIKPADLDYRPSEKVRSTYELMQYLSAIGSTMFRWFLVNDITPEVRKEIADYRATLTIANFSERLDKEYSVIEEYMATITEEQLMTMEVELPWKEKMALGVAIIAAPIKWLTAYRMELFLYLKMNGQHELVTKHAWVPEELRPAT